MNFCVGIRHNKPSSAEPQNLTVFVTLWCIIIITMLSIKHCSPGIFFQLFITVMDKLRLEIRAMDEV